LAQLLIRAVVAVFLKNNTGSCSFHGISPLIISMMIEVIDKLHKFHSASQLEGHEAKGNYIQARITVPDRCTEIELSLWSAKDDNVAHPNLLFVTEVGRKSAKTKDNDKELSKFTEESYRVRLVSPDHGDSYQLVMKDHPYLTSAKVVGKDAWDPETRQLQLCGGKSGLQLTVVKVLQKVQKGASGITRESMCKKIGIDPKEVDMSKVRIRAQFTFLDQPGLTSSIFSPIIFDKAKHYNLTKVSFFRT
jgi:hypothetical protein